MELNEIFIKASVFGAAQEAMGQSRLKLLKAAAPTKWLSHGAAAKRLVSQFVPLVDGLDTILSPKSNAEVQAIKKNTIYYILSA